MTLDAVQCCVCGRVAPTGIDALSSLPPGWSMTSEEVPLDDDPDGRTLPRTTYLCSEPCRTAEANGKARS